MKLTGMCTRAVEDRAAQAPGFPGPTFLRFSRDSGSLGSHPLLSGRAAEESVRSVITFEGQALEVPPGTARLLPFGATARIFARSGPVGRVGQAAAGLTQMTAFERGKGRVVVAGEAGMFAAQIVRGGAAIGSRLQRTLENQSTIPEDDERLSMR